MSHPEQNHTSGPVFEQPDGVGSVADERTVPLDQFGPQPGTWAEQPAYRAPISEETLPLVDIYQPAENQWGTSPYASGGDQWTPAPGALHYPAGGGAPAPYGMQPQQQPYAWQPGGYPPPEHPQATTVLVLGAVGIAVPVLSFVAWYMGSKAKGEIDRGAPFPYSGNLKTGHIMGKVMGILTIVGGGLYLLIMIGYLLLMLSLFAM